MTIEVEDATSGYDPAHDYEADGGTCLASYVYFTTGGDPPNCGSSSTRMTASQFKCQAALDALQTSTTGFYTGEFIRWGQRLGWSPGNYQWRSSLTNILNGSDVECEADAGVHGNGVSGTNLWPSKDADNSSTAAGVWTSNTANSWWTASGFFGPNQGGTYRIYSVNYLNFLQINPPTTSTRASIMQGAATGLLGSLNGVNIGLMRYDTSGTISDGNGGMVTNAIDDIEDNRQPMIDEINAWHFAGNTPLSETLAEAYRYFAGGDVVTGNASHVCTVDDPDFGGCLTSQTQAKNSVAAARTGGGNSGTRTTAPPTPPEEFHRLPDRR
jgi:type IV pilus assembly protein PilY1